ncbi:MAG: flagellar biosynthesis protein FlhB [Ammonifex sp.]|jgi:flagellar biosynthetic protein FlhB|nr:MAG: flagellar biosynthesis protein FlhB [Ammonifex sp.]
MSPFGQGQEKTEPATPKRLQEARRKGSVARSPDLVPSAVFLCLILLCYLLKDWFFYAVARSWVHYLTSFTCWELTPASATAILWSAGGFCLQLLAPVFLVALVAAIAVNLIQVGFLFAPQALVPKLERVSIINGLGRLFSTKGAVEFAKSFLKVCAIGGLVFWMVRRDLGNLLLLLNAEPGKGLILVTDLVFRIAATAAAAYLGLAVLDYMYQRRMYQKEMMMTKTEVKEEFRQAEGDPLVRGWLRRRQRQAILNRIQHQVPKATVVITNPTHVAVALAYEEGMNAPQIMAKGAGYLAMCIKKVAKEHGVPIMENPAVARFLYQKVEVGNEIPVALYQAVAEIIALVYRLRKKQ